MLLKVSIGRYRNSRCPGRSGVRTHLALQALFGCAARTRSRRELALECWRLATGRGIFSDSREELTPVKMELAQRHPIMGRRSLALCQACSGPGHA